MNIEYRQVVAQVLFLPFDKLRANGGNMKSQAFSVHAEPRACRGVEA
jgi:hypothetical protein